MHTANLTPHSAQDTGEALPKEELEVIGLTLGGFKPSIALVTKQVVVRDLEV